MAYQVEGVSITPAELEADSRSIRGVKAHRAAAAHQAIASTPPASPPSKTPTPPPTATPSTTTLRRHAPLLRFPAEDFKIVFIPPLRAYMAAPDNALRGIIYNAVDSQTQDEIVQDLQSMNVNTPYAIADARQMGRSKSILITFVGTTLPSAIVFNCVIYRCHPFHPKADACTNCWAPGHRADVCTKPKSTLCHRCGQAHKAVEPPTCVPCCILCKGAHVTGSRPCKLWFDRNGPSSPPANSKPQPPPPAPLTEPIHKTSRPSRRRSASRGARSSSRHRSVSFTPLPRSEASTAPITATAPSQTPPQLAPAEEPMNTAPSAASSRGSPRHVVTSQGAARPYTHQSFPAQGYISSPSLLPTHRYWLPGSPPGPLPLHRPPTTLPAYTGSPNPDLEADISLGEGTPQGSVLSPLLFTVTLFPLARALRTIPALSHGFYADDITLWMTTGNLGDMETTLQVGVDAVATHTRSVGLNWSPAKSELLLLLPRGMAPLSPSPLTSNGKHTTLITRLTNTVHQTIRLIRRIANRHHGMREHDLRRPVEPFVLSRFIYSLPYIFLSRTEEDKVNSLIRQAYKSALSLPTSTSTARLL
ncbi:hypothetical protein HPB49_013229 [Dermacentor silvarum]|uniref:Uncharacterized protein n=1 Tax=Dermacentor silvarum TaxID=543639 RepID=A0ACB8CKT9_DERSI|nr:hypothetical protein HPB49_013229 [Dermacentor silvarum]